MKKLTLILTAILFVSFVSIPPYLFAAQKETITNLSNRNYFPEVHQALSNAKKSIWVVMYSIDFNPYATKSPTYRLMEDLVSAQKRGVKVRVIMEGKYGRNKSAYSYLKDNGVWVNFDSTEFFTHNKEIIVDKELVIIGSTNWTDTAMLMSNEGSVLIKDGKLARALLKDIARIKLSREAAETDPHQINKISIPRQFMYDERLAGKMLTRHDRRSFDLYLILLYLFDGNKEGIVPIDYYKIAAYLGLDIEKGHIPVQREIRRVLRRLEKNYQLISCEMPFGKPPEVKLLDYNQSQKTYTIPERVFFEIPYAFWEYDWNRKLSFAAEYCYLINLYESELSHSSPWWHMSSKTIAKKFKVGQRTITKGMRELKKLNLIEVKYSEIKEGYKKRLANYYCPKKLLSEEEIKKRWKTLTENYNPQEISFARELAAELDEENKFETVEKFINLIQHYGMKSVQKANQITAKKAVDNPKKDISYTEGILKQWERKGKIR